MEITHTHMNGGGKSYNHRKKDGMEEGDVDLIRQIVD